MWMIELRNIICGIYRNNEMCIILMMFGYFLSYLKYKYKYVYLVALVALHGGKMNIS